MPQNAVTEFLPLTVLSSVSAPRNPCSGMGKSLIIGIDVGTTRSAVSYALFEPGNVPQIQPVMWSSGQRRVPSVVCYDRDGNVIAAGPETNPEVNPTLSEIDGVRRAEWFKLRLRPPNLSADKRSQLEKIWFSTEPAEGECENNLPLYTERVGGRQVEGSNWSTQSGEVVEPEQRKIPHPVTDDFKTAVQVIADFLQYLFKSAKEYIIETERNLDPTFTWSAIKKNIIFVLSHPNGWEGRQQLQMRDAAIAAGLVNRSTAANRIFFVTEGEASLHFCLDRKPELRQESGGLLVVDCGGGTIDLSAYSQTVNEGFKEIVSPDCLLQGSIFVTTRARDYFKGRFKGSEFGSNDGVDAMARAFDKPEGVKCMFRHIDRPYFVKFGGLRENDWNYGISGGKFKVEGAQVAEFFEPAINDIITGIINLTNAKDGVSIKYILLVGGFGRSEYLYAKLSNYFERSGIVIFRPDITHVTKAVADGAVSWYLDRYVLPHSYGVMARHLLGPSVPDHLNRESTKATRCNSKSYIYGKDGTILKTNPEVSFREAQTFISTGQFAAWNIAANTPRGQAADVNQVHSKILVLRNRTCL